jgi:DNA-binding transcriptional ArsR family regulator
MSLLPSKPDTTAAEDAEPRVVGVESDDADDLLSALSSDTARRLLGELHDDPAPPGELADRVDTSLQNAQYHLQNLEEAGAVEVIDTAYSEKGREMDVYAPADQPLVIFAGDEAKSTSIRTALSRLLGAVGLLAVVSSLVQVFSGEDILPSFGSADGAASDGAAAAARTPTPVPEAGAVDAATGVASGLGPGAFFFLGGTAVLVGGFLVWYVTQ